MLCFPAAIIYHCDLTKEPLQPHTFREVTVKGFSPADYQTTQVQQHTRPSICPSVCGLIAFALCLCVSYRCFIPVKTAPKSQCLLSIRKESSWMVPILPSYTDTEVLIFPSHPATGTIQTKHTLHTSIPLLFL